MSSDSISFWETVYSYDPLLIALCILRALKNWHLTLLYSESQEADVYGLNQLGLVPLPLASFAVWLMGGTGKNSEGSKKQDESSYPPQSFLPGLKLLGLWSSRKDWSSCWGSFLQSSSHWDPATLSPWHSGTGLLVPSLSLASPGLVQHLLSTSLNRNYSGFRTLWVDHLLSAGIMTCTSLHISLEQITSSQPLTWVQQSYFAVLWFLAAVLSLEAFSLGSHFESLLCAVLCLLAMLAVQWQPWPICSLSCFG